METLTPVQPRKRGKRFIKRVVMLTPDLAKRLDDEADRRLTTRSTIIRQACEELLKTNTVGRS